MSGIAPFPAFDAHALIHASVPLAVFIFIREAGGSWREALLASIFPLFFIRYPVSSGLAPSWLFAFLNILIFIFAIKRGSILLATTAMACSILSQPMSIIVAFIPLLIFLRGSLRRATLGFFSGGLLTFPWLADKLAMGRAGVTFRELLADATHHTAVYKLELPPNFFAHLLVNKYVAGIFVAAILGLILTVLRGNRFSRSLVMSLLATFALAYAFSLYL